MQLFRSKFVLPIAAPPIEDGVVAMDGEWIVGVGKRTDFDGPFTDLGECVLLPGFINAHCHLDYSDMAGRLPFRGSFTDWISEITGLKRTWSAEDYEASARRGVDLLLRSGTTTVCDIEAAPDNLEIVAEAPVRVLSCLEMIDVLTPAASESSWKRFAGISPHAPFTVSATLYRRAFTFCQTWKRIFTTHLAESLDEAAMFERARGPLYERLAALGRPTDDCGHGSSVKLLDGYGVLRGALVVHANWLSDDDIARLARARATVVHCPSSHRFFNHPPFPLARLREAGVAVCLGTDSAASGSTLDMRAELGDFSAVRPSEALAMATMAAAKALHQPGVTGTLTAGSRADLIAVPMAADARDPAEAVVASRAPVRLSMVNGKAVHDER
ncbi:MAG: amidohydrolase family protein [Verrucomicrobia bacterium]|nr:amidohydrolase family protein [Verrucomicrobiota bacterium]